MVDDRREATAPALYAATPIPSQAIGRHSCGEPWGVSGGPGRVVGAIARSITGVSVPLPDDFTFEYCAKCSQRNMTPELEARFLEIERDAPR